MDLIEDYLKDRKGSWAPSTLRSERHRLRGVASLLNGDAEALWQALQDKKPYTRTTVITRVRAFYDWGMTHENPLIRARFPLSFNPYTKWAEKNFKLIQKSAVYEKRIPKIRLADAKARLALISDPAVRQKALNLLDGGLRYFEEEKVKDGKVKGKGGKSRSVFMDGELSEFDGCYDTFRRQLARVGFKPHDLRKIAATAFARSGMDLLTLCQLMGWDSPETAKSYLQEHEDDELKALVKKAKGA